ncbi:hypothetical protein AB5J56_26135 [Streptomyces sp. R21]|uniref:Uncharacterized protein n=1 Tax=Streptomyces sp. R21 TaxID=3238627 RepID=A0AB39PC05_9ACTN
MRAPHLQANVRVPYGDALVPYGCARVPHARVCARHSGTRGPYTP